MIEINDPFVVGVRFSKVGKIYHFSADELTDVRVGDKVVVETSRGWQLGTVAQIIQDPVSPPEGWKSIDRRATPRDLLMRQTWEMKEPDVVTTCRTRASELRLSGIKIVSAEYSFDGSRLTILFSTETEEKYDLKSLRQDMQKKFAPAQVDMRQVGPRDVAKVHCGMGACGMKTRCCCLFLTEFSSISIRMAKEQGISLTPSEITGMCGRLRCCLIYEYDTYVEARKKLPKRNKLVRTPQGDGRVIDVVPLRGSVYVDIPEVGNKEIISTDIILLDDSGIPMAEQPYYIPRIPVADETLVEGGVQREKSSIASSADIDIMKQGSAREPVSERRQRFLQRPDRGRSGPGQKGGDTVTTSKPDRPGSQDQAKHENKIEHNRPGKDRRPGKQQKPTGSAPGGIQGAPGGRNNPQRHKDNRRKRGQQRNDNEQSA